MSPAPTTTRGKLTFGEFQLDLTHRVLLRYGTPVSLDAGAYDLLVYFAQNPLRLIPTSELMDLLWPNSNEEDESDLSLHVTLLRQALAGRSPDLLSASLANSAAGEGDLSDSLVVSIPGRGYCFTAMVSEASEARGAPVFPSVRQARAAVRASEADAEALRPVERAMEEDAAEFGAGGEDLGPISSWKASRKASPEPDERVRTRIRRRDAEEHDAGDADDDADGQLSLGRLAASFLHPGPTQVLVLTALVVLLGACAWLGWRWGQRPRGQWLTVVVGDVDNTTGDADFDPALRTALMIDLQQTPYLDLAAEDKVRAALHELKDADGMHLPAPVAAQICQRVGGQVYMTGAVSRLGRKYLIAVQAFACGSGDRLAQTRGIADSPDGVVTVLDKVAVDLRRQLGEPGKSVVRFARPLFEGHGASLAALNAYAEAAQLRMAGKFAESIQFFERSIALDANFALAHAGLGAAYASLGQRGPAATSLTKAYEMRETVDEQNRYAIAGWYDAAVTGDISAALRSYQQWSDLYPRSAEPLVDLAQLELRTGKAGQALVPARRAVSLVPAGAAPYRILAQAQMQVGQFEEAAATCRTALARDPNDLAIHKLLYELAFLRLDQPAMDEQVAWAHGAGAAAEMALERGQTEFAVGRTKAAQATLNGVAESFRKRGLTERADSILAAMPRAEAELGLATTALAQLERLPAELSESDTALPVAWAWVGETAKADALLTRTLAAHPGDTLLEEDAGPQVRAAIAIHEQKPQEAVDALQVALPYDLRSFDVPVLRGRAYLALKQPVQAEAEFHKVLDHPGIEPLSYNYALAQLGVARALTQQGKLEEAGFAYKVLLQIWKEADSDLPRLHEAQAEYGRLFSTPVKIAAPLIRPAAKPKKR